MTIDHTTQPTLSDSVKTARLDAPVGANVLRVEPIVPESEQKRGLRLVTVQIVTLPDGRELLFPSTQQTGGRSPPRSERRLPFTLDSCKVEAHVFCLDGPVELSLRVTAGTRETIPEKLDPKRADAIDEGK